MSFAPWRSEEKIASQCLMGSHIPVSFQSSFKLAFLYQTRHSSGCCSSVITEQYVAFTTEIPNTIAKQRLHSNPYCAIHQISILAKALKPYCISSFTSAAKDNNADIFYQEVVRANKLIVTKSLLNRKCQISSLITILLVFLSALCCQIIFCVYFQSV